MYNLSNRQIGKESNQSETVIIIDKRTVMDEIDLKQEQPSGVNYR
ncbi:MAG: hypothetical protein ACI93V_000364 [Alteromonadaceae bacterium]|jgi:hypothetical protein|tara:strand:- start:322 stop:456 length:135 start_codon:yes stop_codon:yes gene_type:complete